MGWTWRSRVYARALWRVLALVSTAGSIGHQVVSDARRDDLLAPESALCKATREVHAQPWATVVAVTWNILAELRCRLLAGRIGLRRTAVTRIVDIERRFLGDRRCAPVDRWRPSLLPADSQFAIRTGPGFCGLWELPPGFDGMVKGPPVRGPSANPGSGRDRLASSREASDGARISMVRRCRDACSRDHDVACGQRAT